MQRLILVLAGSALVCLLVLSCGPARTYTATPVSGWDYVRGEFPEPPGDLPERDQLAFEQGWRSLVEGDLETAAGELERLSRRHGNNASVESALGYLELRLGNRGGAEAHFTAALKREPSLSAAQAGMVILSVEEDRDEEAYERLRVLEAKHPEHPLVQNYLPNLQLKLMESKLQAARLLKSERRYPEAADVYREALRIAPAVGGLYAEAAEVELLSGDPEKAAEHAEKALELEPASVDLYRLRGDALRAAGDIELAVEAYGKARELRPEDASLAALVDEVRRELERESFPSEYLAISRTERVTREQLAALLFIRLRSVVENAEKRVPFIATDVADSWAREFIRQVVATEILDVFPNHTFQPQAFVRRGDLAVALTALWDSAPATQNVDSLPEPAIQDVSPENLNYRSVAFVVSLDLLPLEEGGRFEPLRFVDGQEAVDAVDALAKRMTP